MKNQDNNKLVKSTERGRSVDKEKVFYEFIKETKRLL